MIKEPEIVETKRLVPRSGPEEEKSCPYPWKALSYGEKVSKEDAEYKKGKPFRRCGICQYREGQKCEIVAGFIAPYQGCKYFQKTYDGGVMATIGRRR